MRTSGGRAKVDLVVLVVILAALSLLSIRTAEANTGCPDSTSSFGDQLLAGNCTIDTDTTWANGVLTISGNVVVFSGVQLTLNNLIIRFDPSIDEQFRFELWGHLVMTGGGMESTNNNHWRIITAQGSTVSIDGADFSRVRPNFSGATALIENSIFRDTDNSASADEGIWIGPRSTFRNNTIQDWSLSEAAAVFIYSSWGEISIWGNEFHLNCFGSNCMAVETRNMAEQSTSVFPGFPIVEIAWNNMTWEQIGPGDWAITLDNEYSERLHIHNNTQYNEASESVGNCLQGGGSSESIYENNTCYGPTDYGIWDYIYSNTGNVFQNNWFEDTEYGGIFQIGAATVAHNTFKNVAAAGIWICPSGGGCAGSLSSVVDNFWYDNTFTYNPGASIARASLSNMFDNTLIHHGNGQATQWTESGSGPYHTVPGDGNWLYWANQDIEKLQFVNATDGTRHVNMGVGGKLYRSEYVGFGTTDNASLTVDGLIDQRGSSNYDDSGSGTFLWSLSPQKTDIDVLATGDVTFTVENFFEDTQYEVSVDGNPILTFTTDDLGFGFFTLNFASQHSVVIEGQGVTPPPDGTAPAHVTDLATVVVESDHAILQWGAPGDDGSVGQATTYDVRYSTAGPLNETTFGTASPVPVEVPPPAPAGSTERLNVTGLSPGTEYWFALRTADEVPNWSPVSNNVNITTSPDTPPPDESPPAQVTDLEVVVVNSEYVILQWGAPGDDGSVGQATTYDVRYSTAGPLDGTNFDSAASVLVEIPSPATAGSTERLNVSGLWPGTEYWFALRTADEVPNWSPVSNSVNATTLLNEIEVDDTPPTVTIVSPSEGAEVRGNVLMVIAAVDDVSVEEVKILIDGNPETTLDEAPYEWSWSTSGVSPGSHIIRAEATDPTGNVGWDEIQVVVSQDTPIIPGPEPPTVESISYDHTEGRFDIQFSKPMDRTSAGEALHIEPQIPYTTSWTDDSNITVVLQETAQADTTYVLTIDRTAADSEGILLAEAFTFSFNGVDPGGSTLTISNLWLPLVMLLATAWVVAVGLLLWSRRGVKRLRLNIRQLATQIEELNTKSSTPGEIKVYHRY